MITENIKKGTGLGHDAALRVDLVQKKADYEKSGYKFNHDETLGWEAKINESAYGPFERLEALLDHLDGLKEIEDTFRPVRPVTDENRVPDGTRVTFPHNGQTLEGKIDTLIFPHNGTYCIKAMVGGIESEFYLRPGEFEVLAEEAAETVETETAAPETEEAAPAGQMTLDEIEEVEDFLTNGWAIRKRDSGAYWAHKVINGKPVTIEETDFDDFLCRMEEFDPPKDVRPAETLPTSEIKKVRFQLTDEDVKMKTDSLLEVMTVIDTKKTALADIKKDYKKALDKLQEEQDELADQIRSRVEYRPIECLIEYDLNRGEKIYYRPDTQEQIDRVSMSKDELRIALANQNQANLKHGQKDLF